MHPLTLKDGYNYEDQAPVDKKGAYPAGYEEADDLNKDGKIDGLEQ